MLTSLTLKEYTTFIKETTFDFKATNYKILNDTNVKNKVLKGCLFVGENASGKTKALKAIVFLLDLLFENSEINFMPLKSMYTKGTKFNLTYTFLVNQSDIKYEIELDGKNINIEKLYLNNELILERLKDNGVIYISEPKRDVSIDSKISLLRQEYYKTKFDGNKVLNEWFDYLKNSIYFNCLLGTMKSYNVDNYVDQSIEKYLEKNGPDKLNEFLNKFGYNSEIVISKEFANQDSTFKAIFDNNSIGLRKTGTTIAMPLTIESTGNIVFINLLLPIIYSTTHNGMLIVDEFSSGLHNELEEALIKYFFNNSDSSQIFFVSHSTNLLDTFILRPDQVYSFKFDAKDGTIIKRFSEENPRESQNMEKMYLNGVFDGKPSYSFDIFNG